MGVVVKLMGLDYSDDFIVASGNPVAIRHIIGRMMKVLGCENYSIKADPSLLRPGKQPTLIGDTTKIRRATGWRPSVFGWILPMMPPARSES
jgi:GDP-D-mannose dehydratase